jgi:hypothetical protein
LCGIRRAVAAAVEIEIDYTEPVTLRARYADLMAERAAKEAR